MALGHAQPHHDTVFTRLLHCEITGNLSEIRVKKGPQGGRIHFECHVVSFLRIAG